MFFVPMWERAGLDFFLSCQCLLGLYESTEKDVAGDRINSSDDNWEPKVFILSRLSVYKTRRSDVWLSFSVGLSYEPLLVSPPQHWFSM